MKALIDLAFDIQLNQLVDSDLESTRIFWRQEYLNFSDAEARDPRNAREILEARDAR